MSTLGELYTPVWAPIILRLKKRPLVNSCSAPAVPLAPVSPLDAAYAAQPAPDMPRCWRTSRRILPVAGSRRILPGAGCRHDLSPTAECAGSLWTTCNSRNRQAGADSSVSKLGNILTMSGTPGPHPSPQKGPLADRLTAFCTRASRRLARTARRLRRRAPPSINTRIYTYAARRVLGIGVGTRCPRKQSKPARSAAWWWDCEG